MVDLERVNRQAAQVAEGRVTDAEVVNGELHAQFLELVQLSRRQVVVAEQGAFGDLEHQARRGQTAFLERPPYRRHQRAAEKLARRDIDRHAHPFSPGPLPEQATPRRLADDPFAHRDDEPRFFQQGDKPVWQNYAVDGVVPA